MQTVGSDLGALLGGNYVNRFNLAGPQLQGHPAGRTQSTRLNAGAVGKHLRQGAGQPADSRSARSRDLEKHTTPRALNRFQQLNSVKLSGVAIVPLDAA